MNYLPRLYIYSVGYFTRAYILYLLGLLYKYYTYNFSPLLNPLPGERKIAMKESHNSYFLIHNSIMILIALTLLAIFLTFSRSAYLMLVISTLTLFIILGKK